MSLPSNGLAGGSAKDLPLPQLDPTVGLPPELDIIGGWGYSRQDACILLVLSADDGNANELATSGVACEYDFIPARIAREFRRMPGRENFVDIQWSLQRQELQMAPNGKRFDRIIVLITALTKDDAVEIRKDFPSPDPEDEAYMAARANVAHRAIREYWFDLSHIWALA